MIALSGILFLLASVYVRPHEIWPALRLLGPVPLAAVCLFGLVVDVRNGRVRPLVSPLVVMTGLFFAFCLLDLVVKVPGLGGPRVPVYVTSLLLTILISQVVQGLRPLRLVAGTVVALSLFLAGVATEQALAPRTCMTLEEDAPDEAAPVSTGRACEDARQCAVGDDDPSEYRCERQGLFGTTTAAGRVRYRGLLQDPNELAWAVSAALPLLLALGAPALRRARPASAGAGGRALRLLMVAALGALAVACVVLTHSRTGQLAVLAAVAAFFARRPGVAAGLGLAVAVPLAMLGGRAGAEAQASTEERIECWARGLDMWRDNPLLGVGPGQFTEHHYLTAHNSFVLALAETGPIGLFLWTAVLYLCFKTALAAQRHARLHPEAAPMRPWASALVASCAATAIASFFLSLVHHAVLWIFVGLCAALHAAFRRHEPGWRVRFGWRDAALVAGIDVVAIGVIHLITRLPAG
jgi:hypothetical protein